MLHPIHRKLLLDKLNAGFICFIRHKKGSDVFEWPFQLLANIKDDFELLDYITKKKVLLSSLDISSFTYKDENKDVCNAKVNEIISNYQKISDKYGFVFLSGENFFKLVFRSDDANVSLVKSVEVSKKNLLIFMNLIQSTDLSDYYKLMNNDPTLISRLRAGWKSVMMTRYEEVMKSLEEEEKAATDQVVKDEINSIKEVIKTIPKDIDDELKGRKTYKDVLDYWPTLLLPKSTLFNVS